MPYKQNKLIKRNGLSENSGKQVASTKGTHVSLVWVALADNGMLCVPCLKEATFKATPSDLKVSKTW